MIVPRGCWVQNIILQWLDYAKVGQGIALIGNVRSDAMARQELKNPNDLLQY